MADAGVEGVVGPAGFPGRRKRSRGCLPRTRLGATGVSASKDFWAGWDARSAPLRQVTAGLLRVKGRQAGVPGSWAGGGAAFAPLGPGLAPGPERPSRFPPGGTVARGAKGCPLTWRAGRMTGGGYDPEDSPA